MKKKAQARKKQRGPRKSKQSTESKEAQELRLSEYIITEDAIGKYSNKIQKRIEELHALLHKNPENAIPKILEAIEKHPRVPTFCNYISVAYKLSGNSEKSEFWAHETYRRHPDYLFAKINLANLYLEKKQLDKVEELFDGTFDLKLLYPKRKKYHITEFVSFLGMVGLYSHAKGHKESATACLQTIKQLAPEHPQTRMLNKKLHPIKNTVKTILKIFAFIFMIPIALLFFLIGLLLRPFKKTNDKPGVI